jgi:hypothetical protein
MSATRSTEQIARIVRNCLERGGSVEIDGLGSFHPDPHGGFSFTPQTRPKVFIAYVVEDAAAVDRLYDSFVARGFDPWVDRKKLLPGQNWPRAIDHAISACDFFVGCFSTRSTGKRGRFQSELRYALDCAARQPFEQIFLIPVRLEECTVPPRIAQEFHYVDLFPDWEKGFERIVATVRKQSRASRRGLAFAG